MPGTPGRLSPDRFGFSMPDPTDLVANWPGDAVYCTIALRPSRLYSGSTTQGVLR